MERGRKRSVLSLKGMAEATKESTSHTSIATSSAGRILASGARTSDSIIASSSSANVPYACLLQLSLSRRLALKLFIEGENGSFAGLVNVSCSATSAGELGARLWEPGLEKRGWTACGGTVAGIWRFESVSSSPTTRVDVLSWVWVRLGDLVLRWHCSSDGKEVDVMVLEDMCSVITIKRSMKEADWSKMDAGL
jgi:hypothetical protein